MLLRIFEIYLLLFTPSRTSKYLRFNVIVELGLGIWCIKFFFVILKRGSMSKKSFSDDTDKFNLPNFYFAFFDNYPILAHYFTLLVYFYIF